jgi:hypothetical protein
VAEKNLHSADDAALGFLYQGQYALLLLWRDSDDEAVVWVETLDDVVLVASGETILEQLKHSMKQKPASLTIASKNVWKTLKAWIDVLPGLELEHSWLHLVAVAGISKGSPLEALLADGSDRSSLLDALTVEAERVLQEREQSKSEKKTPLPHGDRAAGCKAFLDLGDDIRKALLARIRLKPDQPNIAKIEEELVGSLTTIVMTRRALVARHLLDWWNGQILDLLTKKRTDGISKFELQKRFMGIVSTLELDELSASFSTAVAPSTYVADSMLKRQIDLVGAMPAVLGRAIQMEWRARQERAGWANQNPAHRTTIVTYDERLVEEWSSRHVDMCDAVKGKDEGQIAAQGLEILKWSHFAAPKELEPIAPKMLSPHYVRGAYQILSITGQVGWHPDYRLRLGFS